MKKLIIGLVILIGLSIPAYAQMEMMGGQQSQMGQGQMGQSQQMPMMQCPMMQQMPGQGMMQGGQQMPMMQMMGQGMMQDMMQMMMNMMDIHIKDPKTATEASQMEMMEQMKKAYECLKGAPCGMTETPSKESESKETEKEKTIKGDEHGH